MQAINTTILGSATIALWFGNVVASICASALRGGTPLSVASASLYGVGAVLVTGLGNVPLNDELASTDPSAAGAQEAWDKYRSRWNIWNIVRTLLFFCAALGFAIEYGFACAPPTDGARQHRVAAGSGTREEEGERRALRE